MRPLSSPDSHHLTAAIGWLGLGNHVEANKELEKITPRHRTHPDVLEVRCRIYMEAKKWDSAVDIANAIVLSDMSRVNAWLYRSRALHELKRTEEAYDHLDTAVDLFPSHWRVQYDLACYACQLGWKREAWKHLSDAIEFGDEKAVKLLALKDPLLEVFWTEIGEV